MGPNPSADANMRFKGVGKTGDTSIDLVVTAIGSYVPSNTEENRCRGVC